MRSKNTSPFKILITQHSTITMNIIYVADHILLYEKDNLLINFQYNKKPYQA